MYAHGIRAKYEAVVMSGTGSAGGPVVPAGWCRLLCTDSAFSSTRWRLLRTSAADEGLVSLVSADAASTNDGQLRSVPCCFRWQHFHGIMPTARLPSSHNRVVCYEMSPTRVYAQVNFFFISLWSVMVLFIYSTGPASVLTKQQEADTYSHHLR